ncbi:Thiamine pyrophosphate enzyme, C-terminal TPP binding domain [Micromonospora narathiwatensis]|uniref:Thiamine pyrophosphate enzyme, C-terminal TPP binding domain n=1 Tax=Micromonospora narathiwatensis TaxID=299146 RepID=A0A1A8ZJ96_9ACTN|nr:Thiamine pyrophosphate enzyme, C-terminal TPP binding domain [Micromonospora narathiwatensis]
MGCLQLTSKRQAIAAILNAAGSTPVICTTGYTSRIAQSLGHRPHNFYMTGSMGLAAALGAGVASATARPVIVIDGDGSVLMNTSALCTIGSMPALPLTHIVLDDGRYASTGGQPTYSERHDLTGIASAAGYPYVMSTAEPTELTATVARRATGQAGPLFLHCRLSTSAEDPGPRVAEALHEHAAGFRRAVLGQATE